MQLYFSLHRMFLTARVPNVPDTVMHKVTPPNISSAPVKPDWKQTIWMRQHFLAQVMGIIS